MSDSKYLFTLAERWAVNSSWRFYDTHIAIVGRETIDYSSIFFFQKHFSDLLRRGWLKVYLKNSNKSFHIGSLTRSDFDLAVKTFSSNNIKAMEGYEYPKDYPEYPSYSYSLLVRNFVISFFIVGALFLITFFIPIPFFRKSLFGIILGCVFFAYPLLTTHISYRKGIIEKQKETNLNN